MSSPKRRIETDVRGPGQSVHMCRKSTDGSSSWSLGHEVSSPQANHTIILSLTRGLGCMNPPERTAHGHRGRLIMAFRLISDYEVTLVNDNSMSTQILR